MQSVALGTSTVVEIISAYTAMSTPLAAVADAPAWVVIGAFYLPISTPAKLELIGLVSIDGSTLAARLFDVAAAEAVSGALTTDVESLSDERVLSGAFDLEGRRLYQMQAQCIGSGGYGIVRGCSLIQS